MKFLILQALFLAVLAAPQPKPVSEKAAESCSEEKCILPNCRCASTSAPANLNLSEIPQFVHLTFDDALTAANYDIYEQIFNNKKNPDGCPISASFFISHEYTDYTKVNALYLQGHDISLHSISHSAIMGYWQNLSTEDLNREFGGEKALLSYFANIPSEDIHGMRLPYLQLSGNNSFQVMIDNGIKYDCSWPTQTFRNPGLWPYTLDYLSNQDCPIGPCPTKSLPGAWVVPMIDWVDKDNVVCAMTDSCVNIPTEEEEILEWFIENFNVQYKGNRAPFGFYLHAAWFAVSDAHFPAYLKFVDYLQTLNDVYIEERFKFVALKPTPVIG